MPCKLHESLPSDSLKRSRDPKVEAEVVNHGFRTLRLFKAAHLAITSLNRRSNESEPTSLVLDSICLSDRVVFGIVGPQD